MKIGVKRKTYIYITPFEENERFPICQELECVLAFETKLKEK